MLENYWQASSLMSRKRYKCYTSSLIVVKCDLMLQRFQWSWPWVQQNWLFNNVVFINTTRATLKWMNQKLPLSTIIKMKFANESSRKGCCIYCSFECIHLSGLTVIMRNGTKKFMFNIVGVCLTLSATYFGCLEYVYEF